MRQLSLVLAIVVILLIRYKYKERDGEQEAEREEREEKFVTVCRQSSPDLILPTNPGKHEKLQLDFSSSKFQILELVNILKSTGNMTQSQNKREARKELSDSELATISDSKMWIRERGEGRGLNITMNPSEFPGTSWTPLLHNLSTESIL